jgi:hypothetical protein
MISAEEAQELLLTSSGLFLPMICHLLVLACSSFLPSWGRALIVFVMVSNLLDWSRSWVLKPFKRCLKAYSTISGAPVSPFTAATAAVKIFVLGLSFMLLTLTRRNELLEHEIERCWPHHDTTAATAVRGSRIKRFAGRCSCVCMGCTVGCFPDNAKRRLEARAYTKV